jgi:hypothetical protein
LLDSNDAANFPAHRGITSELYGGGPELRLKQEMLLGIGGWRLLAALDIHKRGIVYYTRPMINQSGGATCTNYFTHVEREQCEKNVFAFIDKLIEASDCKTKPTPSE